MNKIKNNKAFTLIELIVVVGIIGILVGIASPRFTGYTEKANIAKHASNTKVLENSVDVFYIKNGKFPRMSDFAYTADEVESFSNSVRDLSGDEVTLDVDGKYYDLDYSALNDSVSITDDERSKYILQNPKGRVYYLDGLTKKGKDRDNYRLYTKKEIDNMINNNNYIEIDSDTELSKIGSDSKYPLDGKYIQTADIDLSTYLSNGGWEPIGSYKDSNPDNSFRGTFDGGGYKITGLRINRPTAYWQGLFGRVDGAVLENINVSNSSVHGLTYVGLLAGETWRSKTINSSSNGNVLGENSHVGGLIGKASSGGVLIKNSYSSGEVFGKYSTGGLVGGAYYANIENSYSNISVKSQKESASLGGLIGYIRNSSVSNTYSSGEVDGTNSVGGLIGKTDGNVIVKNSYSISGVKGVSDYGGLIGRRSSNDSIERSYWDVNLSNINKSSGGEGKSSVNMKKKTSYKNWDFDNIWEMKDGKYPKLQWQK